MLQWFEKVKKNPVFKFLASVKMSVPIMVIIAVVVAVGTVIESRYNAQVASVLVYRSWWFQTLMGFLWVNILFAALSRIPYKMAHTGFVVVHIGLLGLLAGGLMTAQMGVDGSMRVVEGQASNLVGLPELSLKVANVQTRTLLAYGLNRSLEPKSSHEIAISKLQKETGIQIEKYMPFAVREHTYVDRPMTSEQGFPLLEFTLQSSMFGNVSESLHAKDRPQAQLGPALLELVIDEGAVKSFKSNKKIKKGKRSAQVDGMSLKAERRPGSKNESNFLVARDAQGNEVGRVSLTNLSKKTQNLFGVSISLVKVYEQAVVNDNKLVEKGGVGMNPAIEVKLAYQGKAMRDVFFAKYPDFSLNSGQLKLPVKFSYQATGVVAAQAPVIGEEMGGMPAGHPPVGGMGDGGGMERGAAEKNAQGQLLASHIEFHVNPKAVKGSSDSSFNETPIRVVLMTDGKAVMTKTAKIGDVIDTPWMGMKVALNRLMLNAVPSDRIRPIEMRPGMVLPDSAIYVRAQDSKPEAGAWLMEGDYQTISSGGKIYEVYYGMESIELPFAIHLAKFEKIDYPGSETPMSFQSTVKINGVGDPIKISMNEPLKYEGYTFYQSSYEMGPGGPTASVFSVNKDPGRGVKYLGSIILCIGIVLYSLMKSDWYNHWRHKRMKTRFSVFAFAVLGAGAFAGYSNFVWAEEPLPAGHPFGQESGAVQTVSPQQAKESFVRFASEIDKGVIEDLPIQDRGRIKPLDSFARESVLYVTGKYSLFGLSAVQLYLGLMLSNSSQHLELINIRDPETRVKLGFTKGQRHFALAQLEASPLQRLAEPLMAKQERNSKSLTSPERAVMEVMQQVWLLRAIISGRHLVQGINYNNLPDAQLTQPGGVFDKTQNYLKALASGDVGVRDQASALVSLAKSSPMPELLKKGVDKLGVEVWFNAVHLFMWVAIGYLLIGLALLFAYYLKKKKIDVKTVLWLTSVPFLLHNIGFVIRVYITGFAPVTNMYGTMIWVAYGIVLFGALIFAVYKNHVMYGLIMVGAAVTLFLTQSLPLVLSPDMDPIVAVLRNNFWLSIHVLTITISYAAFTISMLLGNVALVRSVLTAWKSRGGSNVQSRLDADEKFYKEYGQINYRVMQIGVFFLTAGIILGGVWADYSWGRFWGWDPKETWSLIANLGYLSILHAKYLKWVDYFGVLACSPVAYLLVIMAWYGVNFILASGLHSYGFSSGGAAMVATFVVVQMIILGISVVTHRSNIKSTLKAKG